MELLKRIVGLAAVSLCCPLPATAGMEVTAAGFISGTGTERGVVQIRCSTNVENRIVLTRGVVLQLDADAKRDLVLTVGHGLPDRRHEILEACRVLGAHGQPYRIARVWRSADEAHSLVDDWAVVLVDGRLAGQVGRLPAATITAGELSRLAEAEGPVRLLLRQADPKNGDCRLRQPMAPYDYRPTDLLMYSCGQALLTGAPGLSGSPLLMGVEGRSVVVGVHLGWGLQTLDDGRLHSVNLGRPIDAGIAAAIAAGADEARR